MKQFKHFLSLCLLLCISITASAYDFEVDGIYYSINHDTYDYYHKTVYVTNNGSLWGNPYSGSVRIPSTVTYNGETYAVTGIGYEAFRGCQNLTGTVTIPNSVTFIGDRAFCDARLLSSIIMGNSVKTIGKDAFAVCHSLTSIDLPSSLKSIGEGAFYECWSLTSISIPNSVTSIGGGVFAGCEKLRTITLNNQYSDYPYFFFENDCLYSCEGELISALNQSTITIPNSVTRIGKRAFFQNKSLTSITIPESVESIGNSAFADCESLTSITIPSSVKSIGENDNYSDDYYYIGDGNVFYGCNSLNSVHISDIAAWCNIKFYDEKSNPLYYAHNLYLNDELVKDVIIPDGIESIGTFSFRGCNLTSINIPNSVTNIGNSAFKYCTSLTSINIPNSVTNIGSDAFENCTSLPVTDNLRYADTYLICAIDKDQTSYNIKEGTRFIGDDAFYNCNSLATITIPNSVTNIESYAFYNCNSLTSVHISDIASWCKIKYSGRYSNPIYYAHSLYLNDELVKELVIPNSVTNIEDYAFSGCTSITFVTIPNSIKSIGYDAFEDCTSLTEIKSLNPTPPSCKYSAFDGISESTPLYVPKGCVNKYKSAYVWKDFTNITEIRISAIADVYSGNNSSTKVNNYLDEILKTDLTNNGLAFIDRNDITETLPANFIKKNAADEWVADEIALVDAKPFYCPEDVQAEEIAYTRTFTSDSWQALYLPFDVVNDEALQAIGKVAYINNVHQYDADLNNSSKTTVEYLSVPAGAKLMANQMYVIKPNESVLGSEVTFRATNTTLKATANESYSCSSMTTKYTFTGTYQPKTDMATSNAYALKGNGFGQAASNSQVLSPFRFFLTVENLRPAYGSASQNAPKFIGIMVDGVMEGDETTGIQSADYSIKTSGAYNLGGQKVSENYKGIVVKNGRKVIVK